MTKYFSTGTCENCEVDLVTATAADLLDYYQSHLDMSDSGGAFPGSAAWRKAKPHADALSALAIARPDVGALRAAKAAAARDARLANTYQD